MGRYTDHHGVQIPSKYASNITLINELNNVFAYALKQRTAHQHKRLPLPHPHNEVLCSVQQRSLIRSNPYKAAAPTGYVLKENEEKLINVLTDIFNTSLGQAIDPPVALQSAIMMKYFEWLVTQHIKVEPLSPYLKAEGQLHTQHSSKTS